MRHTIIENFECMYSIFVFLWIILDFMFMLNNYSIDRSSKKNDELKLIKSVTNFEDMMEKDLNINNNESNKTPAFGGGKNKKNKKSNYKFKLRSDSKELLPFNINYNKGKYTDQFMSKELKDNMTLTNFNKSILMGSLLSDSHMEKNRNWNPRMRFEHSMKSMDYMFYIYNHLGMLTSGIKPLLMKRKLRNKIFYSLSFRSRQLKCLNFLYDLFYKWDDKSNKYMKTLDIKLFNEFDDIVFAHWIMGDGYKYGNGMRICTDSFDYKSIMLLINMLMIKYDMSPKMIYHSSYKMSYMEKKNLSLKPRISISSSDLKKMKGRLEPHFMSHFLYKMQ
uniref:Homing endonuclease LAGLIDADG domain-containing protein n=1 Tax=Magnusiomyces paraingens TaxID=2606893 RepID=A0A6B9IN36_9ASCO|nr:hypothetical protein [Saprochaete ingens]